MKYLKTLPLKILLSLILALNLVFIIPLSTNAVFASCTGSGSFSCVCTDDNISAGKGLAGTNTICSDHSTTNPLLGSDGIITKVTNIVAIVAGAAAVIMIIISGLLFVTAGGDSQRVQTARNTIIYVVVGLVVILLARSIIEFIVSRIT